MHLNELGRKRFWMEAIRSVKERVDGKAKLREAALIEYCQVRCLDNQLYEVAQYRDAFGSPGWEDFYQAHKDRARIALENYAAADGVVLDRELYCWVPNDFMLGTNTVKDTLESMFGKEVYVVIDSDTIVVTYTHRIEGKLTVLFDTAYNELEYDLEDVGYPVPADLPTNLFSIALNYLGEREIHPEKGDFSTVVPVRSQAELAILIEDINRDIERTGLTFVTIMNAITKHALGDDMRVVFLPVADPKENDS